MAHDPLLNEDQESKPISEENRALCGALDRLLTIGSYYQPSHERFQVVAKECLSAVAKCLGNQSQLEIFINSQGIIIDGGSLGPNEVEARRLFDLLDPLHIALVEIDAAATSDHLHLALATLKKARNNITTSQSYQEIEIKGLPETVRAIDRSLFLKTRNNKPAQSNPKPKKAEPEVTFFDHNIISDMLLSGTDQGQKLEKEFIGIIQGIMATADPTKLKETGDNTGSAEQWLPEEHINAIKGILEALSGTGSDLMNLQHLIAQAQTALEMTGDPELVDLIFSRLQKDSKKLARKRVQPKMIGKDQKGTRTDTKKKLIMSQDEMREIVDNLEVPYGPMPDPMEQAGGDCLSICVQILDLAPTEDLVSGIEETLLRLVTSPKLSGTKREAIITTLNAVLSGKTEETMDRVWPMIWNPLRRSHPEMMCKLWLDLWQGLSFKGRKKAWPYLVNDLLLGQPSHDRIKHLLLLESLSQMEMLGNHDAIVVLENLPALLEETICDEFMQAPPPLLYPVHKVLVGSSIAPRFGPLLHETLVRQAPHKLSIVLLEIMDEYNPINRSLYHAILDQGIKETLTDDMLELAPEIIEESLTDLHWDFMEEEWVAQAITWLGHLGRESALPILEDIILEKKYMVLSGWPLAAREAATAAQAELKERLKYKGRHEDEEVGDSETELISLPNDHADETVRQ